MGDYVVALREPLSQDRPGGRAEIFGRILARTTSFRHTLECWLDQHELASQVAGIGEPTGFPILTLTCTPQVAQAISKLPEVESVVADDDLAMRLLR